MLVILSYPTLCDPMDFGPPGSSIHGILQARILEWVAIPFSRRSFQFRDQTQVSRIIGRFFTIWAAREAKQKPCLLSNKNIRAVKVKVSQSCLPLQSHGLHSLWNFPSQNTGVGSCYLFQGIFPTQGSNPDLPNCRWILYELSYKGSPRILECVAYPFSSGSSQPRNQTGVSCIAGRFFTNWAIREAISVVQFSSFAQLCPTLCDPVNHSTPGLPVHHQLPEFTQTHVHQVSDAIQPSHLLSSPSPPAPSPSQHQGLFQQVRSSHPLAKVLEFQLQHQSFQWTPRTDLL